MLFIPKIKAAKKRQLQICIFHISPFHLFVLIYLSSHLSPLISISLLLCLYFFSSPSLSLFISLFFSSLLLSALPLFNDDDNDRSSGWLSVHTALTFPVCQSACTVAHSLLGEHVRNMQETCVTVFLCKPRVTWNAVGLYLCWKEE